MKEWRKHLSSCLSFVKVRDLEERLVEKEHELKQMKRNLDESEGAIAQVTLVSPISLFLPTVGTGVGLTTRLVCAGVRGEAASVGEGSGGAKAPVCCQAAAGLPACPALTAQSAAAAVQSPAGEEPAAGGAGQAPEGERAGGCRSRTENDKSDAGRDAVGGNRWQREDFKRSNYRAV